MKEYDDKVLVILSVLLICVAAMVIPNVTDASLLLAEKAFLGLFGIAIGRATKRGV